MFANRLGGGLVLWKVTDKRSRWITGAMARENNRWVHRSNSVQTQGHWAGGSIDSFD